MTLTEKATRFANPTNWPEHTQKLTASLNGQTFVIDGNYGNTNEDAWDLLYPLALREQLVELGILAEDAPSAVYVTTTQVRTGEPQRLVRGQRRWPMRTAWVLANADTEALEIVGGEISIQGINP